MNSGTVLLLSIVGLLISIIWGYYELNEMLIQREIGSLRRYYKIKILSGLLIIMVASIIGIVQYFY